MSKMTHFELVEALRTLHEEGLYAEAMDMAEQTADVVAWQYALDHATSAGHIREYVIDDMGGCTMCHGKGHQHFLVTMPHGAMQPQLIAHNTPCPVCSQGHSRDWTHNAYYFDTSAYNPQGFGPCFRRIAPGDSDMDIFDVMLNLGWRPFPDGFWGQPASDPQPEIGPYVEMRCERARGVYANIFVRVTKEKAEAYSKRIGT